ncbi:hypothetical protein J1605_000678 [Eschrichtius robustus]|uniref:Collagen alpha-1(I) chain-like n=1 Tax=Eschrichtius robustus TaxID=9764 RepID=A0AB34GPI3_ESCRO|nr:hypothetical protein J1605_000678 [Eschrichtius robustus]
MPGPHDPFHEGKRNQHPVENQALVGGAPGIGRLAAQPPPTSLGVPAAAGRVLWAPLGALQGRCEQWACGIWEQPFTERVPLEPVSGPRRGCGGGNPGSSGQGSTLGSSARVHQWVQRADNTAIVQKGQKLCSRLAGGCTGDVSQEPFLPEPWMRACYTTDLRIIRGEGSAGEKAVQPPGTPQAMVGDGAGQRGATASLRDSPPVPPAAPQKQHPWLGVRRDPWTPRPSLGLTAHPGCATSKTSRPLDPPPYSGKPQARHTLPGLTKAQPSHTAGTGPRPLVRRRPGGATEQSGLWKGVRGDPADTANGTRSTCLPTPSGTEPQEGLLPPPHQHLQTTWTELSRSLAGSRLNRQCPPARTHACQCWERLAQGQKRHLQPREMCQAPLCAVSPQNLAADPNGSAPPTTRQESSQGAAPRSLSPPRRPPKEPGPLTCPAPSDTHTPAGPLQHRGAPLRGLDLRSISAHQAAVAAGTRGAARAPSPRRPGPPPRAAAPPRVHGVPGAATGAARHLLCFRGAAPASIVSAAAAAAAAAAAVAGAAAAGPGAGPGAGVGAAGVGAPSAAGPGLGLGSGLGLGRHRPTGSEARGGLCARRARRADTTPRGGAARGERCHSCRPHHTPCPPRAGRGPGARARGRRRSAGVGRGAQAQSAGARAHTGACRPAPRPKPRDWEGGGAENRFALQRLGTCTESGSAPNLHQCLQLRGRGGSPAPEWLLFGTPGPLPDGSASPSTLALSLLQVLEGPPSSDRAGVWTLGTLVHPRVDLRALSGPKLKHERQHLGICQDQLNSRGFLLSSYTGQGLGPNSQRSPAHLHWELPRTTTAAPGCFLSWNTISSGFSAHPPAPPGQCPGPEMAEKVEYGDAQKRAGGSVGRAQRQETIPVGSVARLWV